MLAYYGNHFTIYVSQIIMLYTLNLQLLSKTVEKIFKKQIQIPSFVPQISFFLIHSLLFSLCWVFAAACKLPLVTGSGGSSCAGFPLWWLLLLWSTGFKAHGTAPVSCGTGA